MKVLLGICSIFFTACAGLFDGEVCPRKHHALVVALLPLHRGSECRDIVQRGIQQRVALETALEIVNAGNHLQIALKVLDTCSSKEKAVEAALQGIAFAKRRCSRFPVFLGFLGPDDEESMGSLMNVLVNYSHVVPAAVKNFHQFGSINLETIDTESGASRLISFLRYLNWYSFILLFTSDTASTRLATSVIESDYFCLTNSVLQVPSFASNRSGRRGMTRLRRAIEEVENARIVIITDDEDVMSYFTDYVDDEWGEMDYVIYAQKSGILPWRSSIKMFRNAVILHETPKWQPIHSDFEETLKNSTAWTNYLSKNGLDPQSSKIEIDRTITPYTYALHLYSRALKTATRKKCGPVFLCDALKNTTQTEWKSMLEDTVTIVGNEKIRFFVDLDYNLDVIISDGGGSFEIVGFSDADLRIYNPERLKRSNRSRTKQCFVDLYEYEIEPDTESVASTVEVNTDVPAIKKQVLKLNFGYYELMATVIGFPIGILSIIAVTVACVCRGLRVGKDTISTD